MNYLVHMTLADSARPSSTTPQQGAAFIERFILPTLERCKQLAEEKRIVAGGPVVGTIGLALIVEARSAEELDRTIGSLPVWPFMNTTVTPLTTFDGRAASLQPRLEGLKAAIESGR
jgi:muconolactone delta-isomerase